MKRISIQLSMLVLAILLFSGMTLLLGFKEAPRSFQSEKQSFQVAELASGLDHPWSLAFLPNGNILITEKPGRLRLFSANALDPQAVTGLPQITVHGQGGVLDIAVHPDFSANKLIYLSYAAQGSGGYGTEVARARLDGNKLTDLKVIFRMEPKSAKGQHFGSRLVFDRQGDLYITLGDRGEKERAQQPGDHAGSVIRLHDDGSVPADNPFVGQPDWKPEKFDLGHRNMQGAAINPQSGQLWTHEHGPQGGDEINIIRPGANYGWPVITYGVNYGSGTRIGEGTHKDGMEQPIYSWVPSIAPSGMAFYTGDRFPQWQGNLFVGALKDQMLVRLELDGDKIVHEERLIKNNFGRIRDVRQGPDGLLYLLTDENNGKLLRLEPVN